MRTLPCLLFFIFFSSEILQAGVADDPFNLSDQHRHSLAIHSDYFFASHAVTNLFVTDYYLGRFLDKSLKDDISRKLQSFNRVGGEFNASLIYSQTCKDSSSQKKCRWSIGLFERNHVDSRFKKDAFELFFRGNKNYAGKTADLGDFNFQLLSYQQLFLGLERTANHGKGKLSWTAGVYINKGQKYYSIESPTAKLYTAPDGYYLDLDLELTLKQSDSTKNKFSDINGVGCSGLAGFSYEDTHQNVITIKADNFGFIQWNKQSAVVPVDSSFRFIGIDASDLFNFSDSIKGKIANDSSFIQGFLTKRVKKSITTKLPFKIEASYFANLKPGSFGLELGANYFFFSNYKPFFYVEAIKSFHKRHRLSLNLNYGGYNDLNAGIGYDLKLGNAWLFHAQSDFLLEMLNSRKGTAQGAFVSLSKFF